MKSSWHSLISFLLFLLNYLRLPSSELDPILLTTVLYSVPSKVKVTLQLTISQSVSLGVEPHLGRMTRYLLLFDSYGLVLCGTPSLTRGRVCLLYMLLALASAVFLGSEFLGTRDHILLSQIWDFPFRRLLRLAGSRWRYSTPPPHGFWLCPLITPRHGSHGNC
jgi:hypothetical protein